MGLFSGMKDKLSNVISMSDESYVDDMEYDEVEEEDFDAYDPEYAAAEQYTPKRTQRYENSVQGNVLDLNSSGKRAYTPIILNRLENFEGIYAVSDIIAQKKIVILNVENCPMDDKRRSMDFIGGVIYAYNCGIQRISGNSFVIAPENIEISGDLLDEAESYVEY